MRKTNNLLAIPIALSVAALMAIAVTGLDTTGLSDSRGSAINSDAISLAAGARQSTAPKPSTELRSDADDAAYVAMSWDESRTETAPMHAMAALQSANGRRQNPNSVQSDLTREATSPQDKMSGAVAALAAAGGSELVEIVVRYDQHPELFDDELVAELGGEVLRSYQSLEMRAIRLPAYSLEELAVEENVDRLSLDGKVASFSVASREAAGLPLASSANAVYEGLGVGVAVIDTGVSSHSDLGENILQYSFANGAYPVPVIVSGEVVDANSDLREDAFGHGTHVAGILAGSGIDSGGQYEGSSKDSTVLALQVLNGDGSGSMSDVMAALDWLYEYGSYFNVRVVNLSLGMQISESNQTDPLVIAVERLWDAGMVVVVAAGNEGNLGNMTITSPGNSRKVITVGSLTDGGTGGETSDDLVSSFSSTGPTVGDLVLKPDLIAPGNRVVAAVEHGSLLRNLLPSRAVNCTVNDCGSTYLELSGTSMAAPIVSAAAARMLQKDPELSPATVKGRLMRSARKIDDEPTAAGAGVLDVDAALNDTGILSGEALSPLMLRNVTTGDILVEDTALLWGDEVWSAGYIFSGGFNWTDSALPAGNGTVNATGYLWTDSTVWAKGYLWTDGGSVFAKGYLWTDGVRAKSLLDGDNDSGYTLHDD